MIEMKNSKTMCMLARAVAMEHPKLLDVTGSEKHILGYGLDLKEIRKIYAREGFNILTNKDLIETHIRLWQEAGYVTRVQNIIYWILDDSVEDAGAIRKLKVMGDDKTVFVGVEA